MPVDGYDIFERLHGGDQLWVASTDNLIQAQQRMAEFKASTPDKEYVIFDVKHSRLIG
jgi:hypothetical protein